jgi:hypothetical protein
LLGHEDADHQPGQSMKPFLFFGSSKLLDHPSQASILQNTLSHSHFDDDIQPQMPTAMRKDGALLQMIIG